MASTKFMPRRITDTHPTHYSTLNESNSPYRPEARLDLHVSDRVSPALNVLKTFAIGASWGGTRSLVAPMPVKAYRTVRRWDADDLVLRISVGLEDHQESMISKRFSQRFPDNGSSPP